MGAAAYQLGNTSSRTITEVNQRWTRLVLLGWDTVQVLPECWDLISRPILVVGSVLMQSWQLGSIGWGCTEPVDGTTLGTTCGRCQAGLEITVDLPMWSRVGQQDWKKSTQDLYKKYDCATAVRSDFAFLYWRDKLIFIQCDCRPYSHCWLTIDDHLIFWPCRFCLISVWQAKCFWHFSAISDTYECLPFSSSVPAFTKCLYVPTVRPSVALRRC